MFQLLALLAEESDRGCALVAGAFLDEVLGVTLRSALIDDKPLIDQLLYKGSQPPMRNFGTRIQIARAMGLLSENEYHDLSRIKDIRNSAAHFKSGDLFGSIFDNPKVITRAGALRLVPRGLPDDARVRFMAASCALVACLARPRRTGCPPQPEYLWPAMTAQLEEPMLKLATHVASARAERREKGQVVLELAAKYLQLVEAQTVRTPPPGQGAEPGKTS